MRKLLFFTVLVCSYGGIVKAEKPTAYTEVDNIMGRLFFGGEVQVGTTTMYAPLRLNASLRVKTTEGATINISTTTTFGALQETPYTAKQSYDILPIAMKNVFKYLYQEALDVDLSQ